MKICQVNKISEPKLVNGILVYTNWDNYVENNYRAIKFLQIIGFNRVN